MTVYNRIFADILAKNTVKTPYINMVLANPMHSALVVQVKSRLRQTSACCETGSVPFARSWRAFAHIGALVIPSVCVCVFAAHF